MPRGNSPTSPAMTPRRRAPLHARPGGGAFVIEHPLPRGFGGLALLQPNGGDHGLPLLRRQEAILRDGMELGLERRKHLRIGRLRARKIDAGVSSAGRGDQRSGASEVSRGS